MKIGDLAKRSGLSAHTLRYYEGIGLLPHADRNRSGQRDYDPSILTWIEFLRRLKTAGMPVRDMLRYADLRSQGAASEPERRRLLRDHRARVQEHVGDLQACLLVLDAKIAGYADANARMNDHDAKPPKLRRQVPARPARARAD